VLICLGLGTEAGVYSHSLVAVLTVRYSVRRSILGIHVCRGFGNLRGAYKDHLCICRFLPCKVLHSSCLWVSILRCSSVASLLISSSDYLESSGGLVFPATLVSSAPPSGILPSCPASLLPLPVLAGEVLRRFQVLATSCSPFPCQSLALWVLSLGDLHSFDLLGGVVPLVCGLRPACFLGTVPIYTTGKHFTRVYIGYFV